MSLTLIFEAHGTTFDNEAHLSSGWNDVALSPLGERQSVEMGQRYKDDHFDAIFCSDLQRAYKSAEIGFGTKWPIIRDARLRECNYGDLTQKPSEIIDAEKPQRISTPFPNGESYTQTTARMKSFLDDLKKNYDGKRVMVIGHRATQYGIENVLNGVPLEKLVTTHFKWQPGWVYTIYKNPPTKQAKLLGEELKKQGIEVEYEHYDQHKHVDIYLPEAKLYIEVEGLQHYTEPKQIAADFKRDHYSDRDGFATFRVTNQLVDKKLPEIVSAIVETVKDR